MTGELATPDQKTLFHLVDDLATYTETLEMLEGQLAGPLEDDERAGIERGIAELKQDIEAIGVQLAGKTDAVAVVLRRLAVERDYIHDERTRLKAKEAACERAEKWLRQYVVSVMKSSGTRQLRTTTNTLFLRTSDAVEITDPTVIPEQYFNAEVKIPLWMWRAMVKAAKESSDVIGKAAEELRISAEPSLSTIKKAIKSGVDVPGADLKFSDHLVCR